MEQDAIIATSVRHRPQAVWHGPAAAVYLKSRLGVPEEEVLSAIACHTTGKADMSILDKVVFLADAISAERSYNGVEVIRALAESDLNAAVIAAMEENLSYLEQKGKQLDADTLAALRVLRAE
jgi:predicted HD superfamily hydrolase involved in NAD metabolism